MSRMIAIAIAVVVIALAGSLYLITAGRSGGDFAECRSTSVAGAGDIGGDFTLVDETGRTVTSAEVLDQPALIYFGYTFCPDVCPLDVARNAEATEILEERGVMVKPIFISIDPARDTPEVVADFTDAMHERMLGLTGSQEQVQAASQAFRTYYKAQEPVEGEEDYYLVDHSTFTYFTMPGHGFVEFFRRDMTGEQMADKVQCFVDAG
ncbi:SCO family protein [Pelagivirga sediminicola]|uniref:SCO family protein n=1 Tax=Pelagivirga sediminicola TaxID=2170575 RepID=A0A2T7G8M5_9RHOB|nr:SCO family protein [Pelagivirga sediminicola]PVA10757.1 SCO family protein [Pelagivirga sediminicola]